MVQGKDWILTKYWKKQPQSVVKPVINKKPRLGQGRAGIKKKHKVIPTLSKEYRSIGLYRSSIGIDSIGPDFFRPKPIISSDEAISAVDPIVPVSLPEIPRSEGLLPYMLLRSRPPPKPLDQLINKQDIGNTKMDIEENSPFQENIILEIYERPDKSYFQETIELTDLIENRNIIWIFLPKQTDIDKILEIIKKKVLKGIHLHLTI